MLEISSLSKMYKKNQWVVKDFNLHINPGEIVAIAGPNGAGKTTIINCVLGILQATKGDIHLLQKYTNQTKYFKQRIAYVPDELLLPEALTGEEYLDFVSSMYEHDQKEKRAALIEIYDMKKALKEPIDTYSHGMKKKTQLIAAFMLDTLIMILDEPFRGLDVEAIIMTKKLMKKYKESKSSILLSTHDLLAAELLCDRVAILSKGKKLADGTIKELKATYHEKNLEEIFLTVSELENRSERFEQIIQNL
jgi:ABC-2 type transport system ATP-binding protein